MKNVAAFLILFAMMCTAESFAQKATIERITLPQAKAKLVLDNSRVRALEEHFKKAGFVIKENVESADVFKGKDAEGDFEVEIITKTVTKKGADPVEITVVTMKQKGVTKTETFAENDEEQFRENNTNSGPRIMSTSTCDNAKMISCVGAAMTGVTDCAACFNNIKTCIRGKSRVTQKLFCVLTQGIVGCLPCGLKVFEVVGCITSCTASGN